MGHSAEGSLSFVRPPLDKLFPPYCSQQTLLDVGSKIRDGLPNLVYLNVFVYHSGWGGSLQCCHLSQAAGTAMHETGERRGVLARLK